MEKKKYLRYRVEYWTEDATIANHMYIMIPKDELMDEEHALKDIEAYEQKMGRKFNRTRGFLRDWPVRKWLINKNFGMFMFKYHGRAYISEDISAARHGGKIVTR